MAVRALLLAALPAAVLAGCSSYSDPTLSITGAEILEQSPAATVVQFTIEAQNANEVELPLTAIRYTLSKDGRQLFSAQRSPEATLRRIGTQSFTIPAVIDNAQVPPGPQTYTLQGTLEYITPGSIAQILFDAGVRRPSVGFAEQVEVNLTP